MPADRAVDPIQALKWCAEKLNDATPRAFSPGEAPSGYLAADVDLFDSSGREPADAPAVAARNGYAVGKKSAATGVHAFRGTIGCGGRIYGPDGSLASGGASRGSTAPTGEPGVWRVETGALLPAGTDRVVRVSGAVLLGDARLRLEHLDDAGAGVASRVSLPRDALVVPAGSFLDERLRALCLMHGVERVQVRPAFSVGYGSIGDELIDLTVAGAAEPGQVRDVNGFWLGGAIADVGQRAVALGILPDDPRRLREIVQRCRTRSLEAAVLSGGVGRGFTDRVVDSFRQMDARILFTEVALGPGLGFVLAKTQKVDVLVLCGRPLWCAALFDLFVAPALLARAGAARDDWDWSRREQLLRPEGLEAAGAVEQGTWGLYPVLRSSGGGPRVLSPEACPLHLPWLPGQTGWYLARPRAEECGPGYYVVPSRRVGAG